LLNDYLIELQEFLKSTTSALAALNVNVTPIVCADKLGLQLIRLYLEPRKVDLSHIKIFNETSITTALEFKAEGEKVNVMLRNVLRLFLDV